jgi:hypothetical protein
VTEEEHFGAKLGRIDIPSADGNFTTQFFSGGSIYRLTPTTEEIARHIALNNQPKPVQVWELPAGRTAPEMSALDEAMVEDRHWEDDEDDDEYNDDED